MAIAKASNVLFLDGLRMSCAFFGSSPEPIEFSDMFWTIGKSSRHTVAKKRNEPQRLGREATIHEMNTVADIRQPDILTRCVSIDLEVDPEKAKIFAFAAVVYDTEKPNLVAKGNVDGGLRRLDDFFQGFDHVIGHNILRHDLPHLAAASSRFVRLAEAPIDTLWLNPLAFPRNPYHHLVKHYQDGRLQTGHVNDPEFDAHFVFEVSANQITEFRRLPSSIDASQRI